MTNPRDAIGLSERLRYTADNGIPDFTNAKLLNEAATALDALQARVKELEADRDRWKRHAQDETETAIAVHSELRTKLSRAEQAEARVKELEWQNAVLVGDKDRAHRQLSIEIERALKAESRATSAEQERDKLQGMLLLCGELGGIGEGETPVAYLRRLIDGLVGAGRARDEALKALKPFAKVAVTHPVTLQEMGILQEDRDAIRRLAAGTEKEGK